MTGLTEGQLPEARIFPNDHLCYSREARTFPDTPPPPLTTVSVEVKASSEFVAVEAV